jgi:FlaA1/EpsC-like NDP-sugar epimerase
MREQETFVNRHVANRSRKTSAAGFSGPWRRPIFWMTYPPLFAFCGWLAFLLRFDFSIPLSYRDHLLAAMAVWTLLKVLVFHLEGMDRNGSHLISSADVARIVAVNLKASFLSAAIILLVAPPGFPRSIYLIDLILSVLGTLGTRLACRLWEERAVAAKVRGTQKRTLIYGAGGAGELLLQDIKGNPKVPYKVIGFVDDNPLKDGAVIHGMRVMGSGQRLVQLVKRYRIQEVLIAIPSATAAETWAILGRCSEAGVSCKTVPGLDQILTGSGLAGQVRDVAVEDLLGRTQVELDELAIASVIKDSVVLVTGAGGSIGSELCRQIARFQPKSIVGYEISENALHELSLEMADRFPEVVFHPAVGSIQNRKRLAEVMEQHRPRILYHAAAYKHVPMMEAHLYEAVENNVFGTLNVALAAREYNIERFVLISSDKAVRPTNVMGATKRVAELLVNALQNGGTKYAAVRFGNVLGSNGSVIPLFKKQIAARRPLTVTHPDMQRYFMTVSEAVQLVLQASAMGQGGEVFVLDMGQPVRIVDLARNLILLSGLRPDEDIRIEFTGVRPGEKLCEELNTITETTVPTRHDKIRIFTGPGVTPEEMARHLEGLRKETDIRDAEGIIRRLQALVNDYHPSWHALEGARFSANNFPQGRGRAYAVTA